MECDSSLVLPGNVVYDHSFSQPSLLSLRHACPGGARRWTALWVVGLAKLFHDWAEWFLATKCLRTSLRLKNSALLRSMRKRTYLSYPNYPLGVGGREEGEVGYSHLTFTAPCRLVSAHGTCSTLLLTLSAGFGLSLRWEEPIVRLPSVMGLCVLTTSLSGHTVRRP